MFIFRFIKHCLHLPNLVTSVSNKLHRYKQFRTILLKSVGLIINVAELFLFMEARNNLGLGIRSSEMLRINSGNKGVIVAGG